jgi:hypothetical protein
MKIIRSLTIICLLWSTAGAAVLEERIQIEALIVTKAELRRHMGATETDALHPATYAELIASRGAAQPDYLVVRFFTSKPGHFSGEAEASIDGQKQGTKLNVVLHYNKGWVEYFVPLDGVIFSSRKKEGSPTVTVKWNKLNTE